MCLFVSRDFLDWGIKNFCWYKNSEGFINGFWGLIDLVGKDR